MSTSSYRCAVAIGGGPNCWRRLVVWPLMRETRIPSRVSVLGRLSLSESRARGRTRRIFSGGLKSLHDGRKGSADRTARIHETGCITTQCARRRWIGEMMPLRPPATLPSLHNTHYRTLECDHRGHSSPLLTPPQTQKFKVFSQQDATTPQRRPSGRQLPRGCFAPLLAVVFLSHQLVNAVPGVELAGAVVPRSRARWRGRAAAAGLSCCGSSGPVELAS